MVLVLLIDVAHVYSTLYRTYFDRTALRKQRALLWTIPFLSFTAGVVVYSLNDLLFWRLLAYIAVFHFIRQQYGFMRVYSRKESASRVLRFVDSFTIYYATIYPLLYWHLSGPRNFNWFVDGDFIYLQSPALLWAATALYVLMLMVYAVKEIFLLATTGRFNWPKTAVIVGTIVSWYFGIVYFNGDMAYTLLNVVSHGIPYMALVWLHGKKTHSKPASGNAFLKAVFSTYGVVVFVGLIFLFAFVEEGLWNVAVWKEHGSVFGDRQWTRGAVTDQLLTLIIPLLAVPQLTHYVLDGFIWKIKNEEFKWSSEVSGANIKS